MTTTEKLEKLGFIFTHKLYKLDENLEKYEAQCKETNKSVDKASFVMFISECTEWNICDACGLIEVSESLKWLSDDDYVKCEEDYVALCDCCYMKHFN